MKAMEALVAWQAVGHAQGTLPAPGLYHRQTAPELLAVRSAGVGHTAQPPAGHCCALPRTRASTHTPAQPGWLCGDCCLLTLAVANTTSFTSPPLTHQASSQNTPITLVSSFPASCSLTLSHLRSCWQPSLSLCWLCPLDSKSHPPLGWFVFMWQPVPA